MEENETIAHALGCTNNIICRAVHKSIKDNDTYHISPIQIEILQYLFKNQGKNVYQKDLEQLFSIRRSTVSGILKTMEKNGFIKRVSISEDARVKRIVLTEEALSRFEDAKRHMRKMNKILEKNIDTNDKEIFFKVIHQVQNNLLEQERNNKND